MRNSNISFFLYINHILFLLILFGCANPQPPSGGPPDTTPPEILEVFPENQTINFQGRTVILKFSKYMDRGKVMENIYISPNIPAKYNWSGKVLKIELPKDIDTSVTYSISLGTEYTDLYNNKPEQAFSLIFSAGSKIDSGFIAGKVYDPKPDGAFIFAYNIDDIDPDTLNPAITKPNYKMQLGSNGEFRIPALKDATYRFFSIRDQFKNDLYEPADAFGASIHDLKVVNSKSEPTILKIGPPLDNTGPYVSDASAIYDNYVKLNLSEPLDNVFIFNNSFEIISEDKSKTVEIISAGMNYENKSRVEIITKTPLDTGIVWNIFCKTDLEVAIRDTLGNIVNDSLNVGKFKSYTEKDTNAIVLLFPSIKDSSEYVQIQPEIEIIFDKNLDTAGSQIKIKLLEAESGQEIVLKQRLFSSKIIIKPEKPLIDSKWHRLEAEFENISSFSNGILIDTNIKIYFKTLDLKVKGNISGRVDFEKEICDFDKYVILKHSNGRDIYSIKLNEKNEWSFKNIETGDYTAEVFCDVDGNGRYSYGLLYPFEFSEPFVIFDEVMNIKPRWTLENVILKVKDTHVH